jgi:enoyl-CoA hydratase/carnithine racemase
MLVDLEMHGCVAVLTMGDHAKRNALSRPLVDAFHAALDCAIREGARAIVVASSARVFCAGGDLGELLATGVLSSPDDMPFNYDRFAASLDLPKRLTLYPFPVVAAVDGSALGGGFELTLCCDAVVASDRAVFALPEVGLGLIPSVALTHLPRLIGRRKTLELVLTQRRIDANEALALGLVNRIADSATVVQAAIDLANSLVTRAAPAAAAAAKAILARETPLAWPDIPGTLNMLERREWKEGLGAFIDRRSPDYGTFWATASRAAPVSAPR